VTWSLRSRLTVSYILVALLCVLMVSALANGVLESTFRRYVQGTRSRAAEQVVAQIGAQGMVGGSWDEAAISTIGMAALEQGMIVRVADGSGTSVWDAMTHNNGLCVEILTHVARNMATRYPNWQGEYTESPFPVRADFRDVGVVTIGYYGPFFLNDEDLTFITSLNRLLLWAALGSLALAAGLGVLMARQISVPLARVVLATKQIASGHREVRIDGRTRVRELDGIAGAVNDLSRALGEQEALRKRLTADMAHELRTPLATLQSHLEALVDGVWQPDQGRLEALHEEILRVNRLVADMENLARYEGDALSLARCDTDLPALVQRIARNHEPQYAAKGVALRFSSSVSGGGEAPLSVDPDKLSQAVINLLSNALEFTPAGGAVDVCAHAGAAGVEIRVADTGVGIGPEDLPRIFERLYRADTSRSRTTGGTGIGLSIARAVVEAHRGSIGATSEPGKGSVFTITLPR
jgi:two-component system, OmpR family, sensor histidine kinase BaeS